MKNKSKSKICLSGLDLLALLLCIFIIAAAGVKEMNVNLGKEFTVSLEANPSTGYTWEASYNADMLKLKEKEYQPGVPKGPAPIQPLGSPGKEVFTFIPIKGGQTAVKMHYQRQWEKSPVQEEEFIVIINEEGDS